MNYPKKLNVGCGFDIREGYLNIDNGDWHKPDMIADITDLKELPSDYFDEIVAQDILEHIDRTKQVHTMTGWARLLSRNGVLKVRVPSLVDMLALAFNPEWQNSERQNYLIQMVYGTQAYPGDYHRCGYTPITTTDLAGASGLIVTRAVVKDTWLYDLAFKRADADLSNEDAIHNAYFSAGRPVDDGALEYWIDNLANGGSRDAMWASVRSAVGSERRGIATF